MTKAISLSAKEAVYISPEASAICTIVILFCLRSGQEDLWQRQPWSCVTKLINTRLQLSLLNCKPAGGHDISAEPKANKWRDIYSFHIAVDAVRVCFFCFVNAVRVIKYAHNSPVNWMPLFFFFLPFRAELTGSNKVRFKNSFSRHLFKQWKPLFLHFLK